MKSLPASARSLPDKSTHSGPPRERRTAGSSPNPLASQPHGAKISFHSLSQAGTVQSKTAWCTRARAQAPPLAAGPRLAPPGGRNAGAAALTLGGKSWRERDNVTLGLIPASCSLKFCFCIVQSAPLSCLVSISSACGRQTGAASAPRVASAAWLGDKLWPAAATEAEPNPGAKGGG